MCWLPSYRCNSESFKGFNISVAFLPKSKHRVTRFEYSINDFCVSNGNCFWSPLIGLRQFLYEIENGEIVNSVNIGNYPTMHWSPLISPHPSRLSAVIVSSLWPPLLLYPSFSSFCPFDRQDPRVPFKNIIALFWLKYFNNYKQNALSLFDFSFKSWIKYIAFVLLF